MKRNNENKIEDSKNYLDPDKKSRCQKCLPVLVAAVIVACTFLTSHKLKMQNFSHVDSEIQNIAKHISKEFEVKFSALLDAQARIASRWESRQGTPLKEFEADAKQYVHDHPEFQAIEWVDPNGVAQWVVPLEGNEAALGWDNKKDEERWAILQRARETNTIAFSKPIDLLQGGKGLLVFVPILYEENFDGYVLAVYKFETIAKSMLLSDKNRKRVKIDLSYNGEPILTTQPHLTNDFGLSAKSKISIHYQDWEFKIIPGQELIESYLSLLPDLVLLFGTLLAFAMSFLVYFAFSARHKKRVLEETKNHHSMIFSAMLDGIISFNQRGVIIEFNPAAEALFGYSKTDVLGHSVKKLFLKRQDLVLFFQNTENVESEDVQKVLNKQIETKAVKSNGDFFVVEMMIVVTELDGRKIFTMTIRDLTEKKSFEEISRRSQDSMLQMQKMEAIGKLAGGVAHDFNNILGGILGYVSLLKDDVGDEKMMKRLQIIEESALRGADLTNKLLGFARQGFYEERLIAVNEVIKEACDILSRSMNKNIELELDLSDGKDLVVGDSRQIFQVIMNLVDNATDAMPHGGKITISTECIGRQSEIVDVESDAKSLVKITISDTGQGIGNDIKNRVFDPFFTTKEFGKGSGLGLSMVHGIMKNHKGDVILESVKDIGTTVSLFFPFCDDVERLEMLQQSDDQKFQKIKENYSNSTILVVDDEPMMCGLVKDVLEPIGVKIITAHDGLSAITTYEKNRDDINLIIMDVSMPNLDGISTFMQIKKDMQPNLKVLFASGLNEKVDVATLTKSENAAFIRKPFARRTLIEKIVELDS